MSYNIFEDIGFSRAEAQILELKSDLMIEIKEIVKSHNLTRRDIDKILGIPQSRDSELMTGQIDKMTIDRLTKYLVTLRVAVGEP
jgi:predicted XRE-type DNA-binding protein